MYHYCSNCDKGPYPVSEDETEPGQFEVGVDVLGLCCPNEYVCGSCQEDAIEQNMDSQVLFLCYKHFGVTA